MPYLSYSENATTLLETRGKMTENDSAKLLVERMHLFGHDVVL